jgi:hypothetical protein
MRSFKLPTLILLLLPLIGIGRDDELSKKDKSKSNPTLEEAIRAFHKGMASEKKEERLKALERITFTQQDMEVLFPKHADKFRKKFEEARKELLEHCDGIAKQVTKHGAVKKVETTDIRTKEKVNPEFQRLFSMIPKDIEVFEVHVVGEDGGGGTSSSYVFVNKRWIFIRDIEVLADFLDGTNDKSKK